MKKYCILSVVFLLIVVSVLVYQYISNKKEKMSGFGVTSGLAFNNRTSYCDPGDESIGYSGGCFLPHKVIV